MKEDNEIHCIKIHEIAKWNWKWKCEIGGEYGLVIYLEKGFVPNFFQRYMQRKFFGFNWIKNDKESN